MWKENIYNIIIHVVKTYRNKKAHTHTNQRPHIKTVTDPITNKLSKFILMIIKKWTKWIRVNKIDKKSLREHRLNACFIVVAFYH